jgi:UDP-N-acetylglucosamine/UDP-N-acetylgalactosamine diphosphorylase
MNVGFAREDTAAYHFSVAPAPAIRPVGGNAMPQPPRELVERLSRHGQQHLTYGWERLSTTERNALVTQIARIDFATLRALQARDTPASVLPSRETICPVPVQSSAAPADVRAAGESALRRGEVAVLLVAGGQGSRLGFEKPKGMYPVGPVSNASLFRIHAEKVLALSRRYGRPVPLLVMTSPATHTETEAYFREHDFFGLPRAEVRFFQQGTMPAVDIATGRLLLEAPGRLFLSPDGHGGTLTALADSGLLAELERRGVRHVFYFQVDNPLVKVCDPAFLGHHVAARSEASSKVVFKEQPEEKVGVLAAVGGRCTIIEYSDMPTAMAAERTDDGSLRFRAGSPAIHIFDVNFLRRVTGRGLPFHIARKKVPHLDTNTGETVNPAVENALKFELFIFDALPLADRWLVVETSRAEEFAPLKNATGADSPAAVREALSRLHANWLEAAGASVPQQPDGRPVHAVEISPLFALDAEQCRAKVTPAMKITGPTYLE